MRKILLFVFAFCGFFCVNFLSAETSAGDFFGRSSPVFSVAAQGGQSADSAANENVSANVATQKEKVGGSFWVGFSESVAANFSVLVAIALFLFFLDAKLGGTIVLTFIGAAVLLLVFECMYLEGFMGREAIWLFVAGIALVMLDFFFFGTMFLAGFGALLVVASIFISIVPVDVGANGLTASVIFDIFTVALWKFLLSFGIASVLFFMACKFIKKTPLWNKFVLDGGQKLGEQGKVESGLVGQGGFVLAELVPNGKVEILGKAYDAVSADSSFISKGEKIEVVGVKDFQITVKKIGE